MHIDDDMREILEILAGPGSDQEKQAALGNRVYINPTGAIYRDSVIAKELGVSKYTLQRWDRSEKMKALGWPAPIIFNGRRHRDSRAVQAFVRNCAAAQIAPGNGEVARAARARRALQITKTA